MMGVPLTEGLRYGEPGMKGILFWSDAASEFTAEAQRRVQAVLPAVAAAARRIDRFEAERRRHEAVEAVLGSALAASHLALDVKGRLLWASPRALVLLAQAGSPRALPEELTAAAARLGALAAGEVAAKLGFELLLRGPLHAALSRARSRSGEWIVDVALDEPAPEAALAPLALRFGLTPAETRVLSVLTLGHPNREIARRLHVSIETVRTHIRRVLEKLRVGSRAEAALLARLQTIE